MTAPADTLREAVAVQAQAFVDRKYVARADERQKSMGLAYVEAERQDLAREIANFALAALSAQPAAPAGREDLAARLLHAMITMQNDNDSKPMTGERARHVARYETMGDVLEYLRSESGPAVPPQGDRATASAPEPVAWQFRTFDGDNWIASEAPGPTELIEEPEKFRPLYATPPAPGAADRAAVIEEVAKVLEQTYGLTYVAANVRALAPKGAA